MIQLFINGKDYSKYIVDGVPNTDTYTDELDSAVVSIVGVKRINLSSFDKAKLIINDEIHYLEINTYEEQIYSRNPLRYRYNFSLISETKSIEREYFPNIKITRKFNGNTPYYYEFMDKLGRLYLNKKGFDLTDLINLSELRVRTPERTWIKTDARTLINDLLLTIPNHPSIIKVEDNKLKLIDLSKKGNPIDLSKGIIASDTVYQTMSDYANNIVSDVVNIVPRQVNLRTMAIPFRNEESGKVEFTENMKIEIPNAKIEKISKFEISASSSFIFISTSPSVKPVNWNVGETYDFGDGRFKVSSFSYDSNSGGWVVRGTAYLNIADSIVEKSEYDTFYILGGQTPSPNKKYRIHHLYYVQDGNTIYGLGYREKLVVATATAFQQIAQRHAPKDINGVNISEFSIDEDYTIQTGKMKIDLLSLNDGRITTYKDNPTQHNISYEDNQTEPFIDLESFVKQEQEKANRLGNKQRTIEVTYSNYADIPKLGDYIDDYVLCKREISYVGSQAIAKLTLSENYYQKNAYYGLQSRERFTNFALDNNTIVRNANMEYVVDIGTENVGEYGLSIFFTGFYKPGDSISPTTLLYSTYASDNSTISYSSALQTIVNGAEDMSLLTARAKDNFSVGVQVETHDTHKIQKYVSYVDEYGEYDNHDLVLALGRPELTIDELDKYPQIEQATRVKFSDLVSLASHEPYLKDNGEIFNLNALFRFTATHPNIKVFSKLGENNSLVSVDNRVVKVYVSDDDTGTSRLDNSLIDITANRIHFTHSRFNKMLLYVNDKLMFTYTKDLSESASDIYINCIRKE